MENIIYRNPIPSDIIDLIVLVENYCKQENESFDIETVKNFLNYQITNLPCIVAVDTNGKFSKIVGGISFIIAGSDFDKSIMVGRKIVVFVDEKYRNNGVGSTLVQKAEEICKKYGCKKFYFLGKKSPTLDYSPTDTEFVKEL